MREIRQHGSEGGGPESHRASLPLSGGDRGRGTERVGVADGFPALVRGASCRQASRLRSVMRTLASIEKPSGLGWKKPSVTQACRWAWRLRPEPKRCRKDTAPSSLARAPPLGHEWHPYQIEASCRATVERIVPLVRVCRRCVVASRTDDGLRAAAAAGEGRVDRGRAAMIAADPEAIGKLRAEHSG